MHFRGPTSDDLGLDICCQGLLRDLRDLQKILAIEGCSPKVHIITKINIFINTFRKRRLEIK